MEIIRENKGKTSLDTLTKTIEKRSESYLLLATDPESDGATLISINANNMDIIKLFTDLIVTEESFVELFDIAKQIATKKLR